MSASLSMVELLEPWALTRSGIQQGQWWRLWTGHLVHTGASHGLANLAALGMLTVISWRLGWLQRSGLGLLLIAPLLSLVLLSCLPSLAWYAGLSGLLHAWAGLLLTGLNNRLKAVGLMALAAKLLAEHYAATPTGVSGFAIVSEAHGLGALLGLLLGGSFQSLRRRAVKPVNSQGLRASSRPTP